MSCRLRWIGVAVAASRSLSSAFNKVKFVSGSMKRLLQVGTVCSCSLSLLSQHRFFTVFLTSSLPRQCRTVVLSTSTMSHFGTAHFTAFETAKVILRPTYAILGTLDGNSTKNVQFEAQNGNVKIPARNDN